MIPSGHHPELERRILHGLICEWKNAVAFLSPTVRTRLTLPGFELRDFEKRWAEWNRERHVMAFRRTPLFRQSTTSSRFRLSGITTKKSRSLSGVMLPVAAEPTRITLVGLTSLTIWSRTCSMLCWSFRFVMLSVCQKTGSPAIHEYIYRPKDF